MAARFLRFGENDYNDTDVRRICYDFHEGNASTGSGGEDGPSMVAAWIGPDSINYEGVPPTHMWRGMEAQEIRRNRSNLGQGGSLIVMFQPQGATRTRPTSSGSTAKPKAKTAAAGGR